LHAHSALGGDAPGQVSSSQSDQHPHAQTPAGDGRQRRWQWRASPRVHTWCLSPGLLDRFDPLLPVPDSDAKSQLRTQCRKSPRWREKRTLFRSTCTWVVFTFFARYWFQVHNNS
jgi:hypothetical protein